MNTITVISGYLNMIENIGFASKTGHHENMNLLYEKYEHAILKALIT